MALPVKVLIALVVLLHLYFLWFEMFAWTTRGKKIFKNFPPELFEHTSPLAANQGLYNGFIATGLLWTFFIENEVWQFKIAVFILGCVVLAGVFGAISADVKIFWIQGLPALLALILILLFYYTQS
jgi:putative membrane protein